MGALTRVAIDVDEYSVIGGALGEPLRLTPSETWGEKFLVPADAEIVIEGIIPPKERGRHGLRADFARYYSPETLRPVMNVQAITYRRDAIYHDIHLGGRDQDHPRRIPRMPSRGEAIKLTVKMSIRLSDVPVHAYIQIRKTAAGRREAPSLPRRRPASSTLWWTRYQYSTMPKSWAVATRSRWDRDLSSFPT
jgi:hypothetical protein